MSKQVLNEQVTNKSLKLVEATERSSPNCLGTLYGVCADYKNPTRNGNFYSRKLWENVFKDELVKEALNDKILFGELGHPENRLETDLTKACIVMTDYEFDDNEGVVKGHFDILNTPTGKVFKSLLDYGCVCGLSSRGEGDVTEDVNGNQVVAEDGSYVFVAFDAVALPAVKTAKPALQESLKRQTLKESLESQINESTTLSELNLIKKVVESTNMPELDSLVESIDIKSKELEGTASSSNLMEDLEATTRRLNEVEEENQSLKESVTACKERVSRLLKTTSRTSDDLKGQKGENSKLSQEIESLLSEMSERKRDLQVKDRKIRSLNEELRKVTREAQDASDKLLESKTKIRRLEDSLNKSQTTCQDKIKEVNRLSKTCEGLNQKVSNLTKVNEGLNQKLNEIKSKSEQESKDLSLKSRGVLEDYVKLKAKSLSVNPNQVLESLSKNPTTKEVDSLVESISDRNDRYRSVPGLSGGPSIMEDKFSAKAKSDISQEDKDLLDFMKQVTKI